MAKYQAVISWSSKDHRNTQWCLAAVENKGCCTATACNVTTTPKIPSRSAAAEEFISCDSSA